MYLFFRRFAKLSELKFAFPNSQRINHGGQARRDSSRFFSSEIVKPNSYLHQFRRNRALSVTDLISAEWCEKKLEYELTLELEELGETRHFTFVFVVGKFIFETEEYRFALNLLKTISAVHAFFEGIQPIFHVITRELMLLGFVKGQWIVGIIDELRLLQSGELFLIDTKTITETRSHLSIPSEPQKRNKRFQLMFYKLLWDTLVKEECSVESFFKYFTSLKPDKLLSKTVTDKIAESKIPTHVQTFEYIISHYSRTLKGLPKADDELLLQYEFRKDVIGKISFQHDPKWVMSKISECMEFWRTEREATYTADFWKCQCCPFADVEICPGA